MPDSLSQLQSALADRYRIERELGSGGMATVYLAYDLRHKRNVALKVLRPELASTLGPERFLREIDLLASLQHPHILPVHDSGEAAGLLFYTMPYVEGESLRQRLAREGELPVRDVVRTLSEIADALGYAHRHGVIHRDIKPDNVLLADRHALVADFGIAKAVTEAADGGRLTETGISIGTPTYMSPEQAAADPQVDHRADIYALGVVGYELLAGSPPFPGLSVQQVLAAKVTRKPDPVSTRRPAVPAALNDLIMKCLEPRPADRYQSAEDVLAQLETILTPGAGTAATPRSQERWQLRSRALFLAGAAVLVAALVGLVLPALSRRRAFTLTTSNAVPVTTDPGMEFQPALSPSGDLVAYTTFRQGRELVAVRSTRIAGGGEVRPAEADSGDQAFPTWSPDGEFLRFNLTRAGSGVFGDTLPWREVGRLGGAARSLALPRTTPWTAWSRDGKSVAIEQGNSIHIYAPGDSTVRPLGKHEVNSLAWSPDGRWIAYVVGNSLWPHWPNTATSSIWMLPVGGGAPVQVAGGDFLNVAPAWLDARHLLFVSNRDGPREVYSIEVGGTGGRDLQKVPGGTDAHSISVSASGKRLAIAKLTLRQNVRFYPFGSPAPIPLSTGRSITAGTQVVETHDLSPDGKWLVYSSNLRGNADLYKLRLSGGDPVPLTTTPVDEFSPAWSPDGREIAFEIFGDLWLLPAEGGQAERLTGGEAIDLQPAWSADGLDLALTSNRSGKWELWLLHRDRIGGRWSEPTELTRGRCIMPQATHAPSGWWCQQSPETLALVSPTGAVLRRANLGAAGFSETLPVLSPDGATLYVPVGAGDRRGIWAWPLDGKAPRLVIQFDNPAMVPMNGPGALRVGSAGLFLTVSEPESDIWVMDLERSGD